MSLSLIPADGHTTANPLMAVSQPETKEEIQPAPDTTSNPLMQPPTVTPPIVTPLKKKKSQPMMFNPLVARGSPFKAPASPSVTAPEAMPEAAAAAAPAVATAVAPVAVAAVEPASPTTQPEAGPASPLSEEHVLPPSTPVDVAAEAVAEAQQPEVAVDVDIPPPVETLPQVRQLCRAVNYAPALHAMQLDVNIIEK